MMDYTGTATTAETTVLTRKMVEEMMAAMPQPLPMVAMNPNIYLPTSNPKTVGEEREAGNLPSNFILNRAIPLLNSKGVAIYEFDKKALGIPYVPFSKVV